MKLVFLGLALLTLTACDLKQNVAVRGIDIHTRESEGVTIIDFEAIVSMGNLKLPNYSALINNPQSKKIGEMNTERLEDGTSRVSISVNYNEVVKNDSGLGKTLPNHREVPPLIGNLSPLSAVSVLENSRVYVGIDPSNTVYAGVALNVPAFDRILSQVPVPLNIFMNFPFSTEVFGAGGLYSSPKVGQNGLGVFAKKSRGTVFTQLASLTSNETNKIDPITLFRLNHLIKKHATISIK